MAAATKAEENPLAGLSDLTNLINLFTGQKTTTSTSQQGMQALLQNLISGTQGLSAVTSGSKIAGGYNSATQSLMTNDFLTRAAAQAAAGTQTKQVAPAISSSNALLGLGMMGAKSLLGPAVKTGLKKAGLDTENIGASISNAIFGASTGGADAATSAALGQGAGLGKDVLSAIGVGELADVADVGSLLGSGADVADAMTGAEYLGDTLDVAGGVPWFTIANLVTGGEAGEMAGDAVGLVGNLFSDIFGGLFS